MLIAIGPHKNRHCMKRVAEIKMKSKVLKQMYFSGEQQKWRTLQNFNLRSNEVWQF
jgi:hypothetical protein